MRLVQAPNTDLVMSKLGYGCGAFWARKQFSNKKAIQLVERALDQGINYFDTGPSYGAGLGETRLARGLSHATRSKLVISTKVGTHIGPRGSRYNSFAPKLVRDSIQASLRRLKVDYVDILYLHGSQIADINDDLIEVLSEFKRSGQVRYFGINSFQNEVVYHALKYPFFKAYMVQYNLLNQGNSELIDAIDSKGNFSVAATAVSRVLFNWKGLLPTRLSAIWYTLRTLRDQRGALLKSRYFRFLNKLEGMTGAQAALAFTINNPKVTSAVFGTTRMNHLDENIQAEGLVLDKATLERIERFGR